MMVRGTGILKNKGRIHTIQYVENGKPFLIDSIILC